MNLCSELWRAIQKDTSAIAVQCGDQEIRYGDLGSRIERFSGTLKEAGLAKGDRVGLLLPNTPDFVTAYYAALRLGAVVVPLRPESTADEITHVAADAGIQLFIAEALPATINGTIISPSTATNSCAVPPAEVSPSDDAVIIYTSGTTGRPKGAVLTHENILSNARSCEEAFQITANDSVVVILPLYHSFAMTVTMNLALLCGGRMAIVETLTPKGIMTTLWEKQISVFVAIPSVYALFNKAPEGTVLPPTLRLCISGGAGLPAPIFERFFERYQIPILEGYGLSEASPVVSCNRLDAHRVGTIGQPIPNVLMRVVNSAGQTCAVGEAGELSVTGTNIMRGYWNNPQETEAVLRDGWLFTGDLAVMEEDGFFRICGRKKELIVRRGFNVYPAEVESALLRHPSVSEVAVIGREDERDGETPVAYTSFPKMKRQPRHAS